jgi:hypothetical protein
MALAAGGQAFPERGGSAFDQLEGIADLGDAGLGLVGTTSSPNFPTASPAQAAFGGAPNDGFAAVVRTNQLPHAAIAPVAPAECAGPATAVVVDGTGSADLDDPLSFSWSLAALFVDPAAGTATGRFPLGTTSIASARAIDAAGNDASAARTVFVVPAPV